MRLTVYLAGAIRDGRDEDIQWREDVISALGQQARFLNPLAGKHFDPETKMWTMGPVPSDLKLITQHDKWCVEQADICLFNFRALSEGYPNIGTLVEFGMAVEAGKLVYSIVDPNYTGHENPALYHLHPFLSGFSAVVLPDVPSAIEFLGARLASLDGTSPRYGG